MRLIPFRDRGAANGLDGSNQVAILEFHRRIKSDSKQNPDGSTQLRSGTQVDGKYMYGTSTCEVGRGTYIYDLLLR